MTLSSITAFTPITERSEATPGLFNTRFQQLQDNIASVHSNVSTHIGGLYNLRDFGALGDGVTDDRQAFVDAEAAAEHLILSDGTYLIGSTITLSKGYTITRNARLYPASGATIVVAMPLIGAGRYKIFDSSAGGAFSTTAGTDVMDVYPEWFGASNAASAASSTISAINEALAFANVHPVVLDGTYWINDTINMTDNQSGFGLRGSRRNAAQIVWKGVENGTMLETIGSIYCDIRDLKFDAATTCKIGIFNSRKTNGSSADQHIFERLFLTGNFTVAGWLDITSESNEYRGVVIENTSTDSSSFAYIRRNDLPSTITGRWATPNAINGNTRGTWVGGSIQNFGSGSACLLKGVQNFAALGTFFYSSGHTDKSCIRFEGGADQVVLDGGCRFEGVVDQVIHFTGSGTTYNRIKIHGSSLAADTMNHGFRSDTGVEMYDSEFLTSHANAVSQFSLVHAHRCRFDLHGLAGTILTTAHDNIFYGATDDNPTLPAGARGNVLFHDTNGLQPNQLSVRTLAASSITASAANTNVVANEMVFTVGGASGASLAIHSGGTVWIFDSVSSAKAT